MRYLLSLLTFSIYLTLTLTSGQITAQGMPETDYEAYPSYSFDFTHLELELTIEPAEKLIKGSARYNLKPLDHSLPDSLNVLVLTASRIDVRNVFVNNKEVDFIVSGDSLQIPLNDSNKEISTTEIIYQADFDFGIHADHKANIYTSMLPRSVSHYLPGPIHPRTELTTETTFSIPDGLNVISTGTKSVDQAEDGSRRVVWKTNEPISLTDLKWAVGNFETVDTFLGFKKIYLHAPQKMLSDDEKSELLRAIYTSVKQSEQVAGREFPYNELNVVVLPDRRWETRQSVAGYAHLFGTNSRELRDQIPFMVAQQWMGGFLKTEQWSDSDRFALHTATFLRTINSDEERATRDHHHFDQPYSIYTNFSIDHVTDQIRLLDEDNNESWNRTISSMTPDLIQSERRIFPEVILADMWYEEVRNPFNGLYIPDVLPEPDTVQTEVTIQSNERGDSLYVTAQYDTDRILEELPAVKIHLKGRDETMNISGGDTVLIKNGLDVSNIYASINAIESDSVIYEVSVEKPFAFYVDDLRNGSVQDKINAVKGIVSDTSASDRELLFTEQLSKAENPNLKAALLVGLQNVTGPAMGTVERYLNATRDTSNVVVLAGIRSLRGYSGNDDVIYRMKAIISGDYQSGLKEEALHTLAVTEDDQGFDQYISRKLKGNIHPEFPVWVLGEYKQLGDTIAVETRATTFSGTSYSFEIRLHAIETLLSWVSDNTRKEKLVRRWVNDSDPRIRFMIIDHVFRTNPGLYSIIVSENADDEYDARVQQAFNFE